MGLGQLWIGLDNLGLDWVVGFALNRLGWAWLSLHWRVWIDRTV